jgi:hypothetical protein
LILLRELQLGGYGKPGTRTSQIQKETDNIVKEETFRLLTTLETLVSFFTIGQVIIPRVVSLHATLSKVYPYCSHGSRIVQAEEDYLLMVF